MNSILESIKKLIGYDRENTQFDTDIMIHINTALNTLTQVGVGNPDGFIICGYDEVWDDFVGDSKLLEQAKTNVYAKVKLVFDPPASSSAIAALERVADEALWRLST